MGGVGRCKRHCWGDLATLEAAGERGSGGPRGGIVERASGAPSASSTASGERSGDGVHNRAAAGASAMFAGLQDLGVANGEDLKETLTNCTEPLKAIEQFQVGRRGLGRWGNRTQFYRLPTLGWRHWRF